MNLALAGADAVEYAIHHDPRREDATASPLGDRSTLALVLLRITEHVFPAGLFPVGDVVGEKEQVRVVHSFVDRGHHRGTEPATLRLKELDD